MINSARHLITEVFSLLIIAENCISGSKSTTFAAEGQILNYYTPGISSKSEIRLRLGLNGTFCRDVVPLADLCAFLPTSIT